MPPVEQKRVTGRKRLIQATLSIKFGIWGNGPAERSYWSVVSPKANREEKSKTGCLTRAQTRALANTDYDDRVAIVRKKQSELLMRVLCSCTQ